MLALTWKQPYASLMLHGKVETRTWNTKVRDNILICVAKKSYSSEEIIQMCGVDNCLRISHLLKGEEEYYNGQAIAVGTLVNTAKLESGLIWNDTFIKYQPNLFCHFYRNVRPIVPFDWKGSQGWRKVPKEIVDQIQYL